jgi:hypothetical protein
MPREYDFVPAAWRAAALLNVPRQKGRSAAARIVGERSSSSQLSADVE